jgi:two-component system, chemotaxis family, CheB/CheR fusion protein
VKEELQSANEELTTVNDELRGRNLEIRQVNSDLTNLLGSIEIAVVMIVSDLMIPRFRPEAQKFLGLISTDVGRPLLNIQPTIGIPDFQALVMEVMSTVRPIERELTEPQQESLPAAHPSLPYDGKQDRRSGDYDQSHFG